MRKRLLATLPGRVRVYEVDGSEVRRRDVVFVQGGHDKVYPHLVPRREIWVERMRDPRDQAHIAVHEIVERKLMADFKWPYNRAHDAANRLEQRLRRRGRR